ncbi:MAG: 30S ribosome-binding factor RbfA [Candidatus Dormibacteria bacterium]
MEKVNSQLRQELALALAADVKDPRLRLVTVVEVSCSPDLAQARVKVGILGDEPEQERSLRVLRGLSGYLRHLLGERLTNLRRVPRLDIQLDRATPYGVRVNALLSELRPSQGPDSEPGGG